ncbi:phage major capsid protein [Stenotrophomonas maltophilia]|uniref:phage major capsid protein n=2 Tax=Stenotrophomonas maltophilia TaxID=40324 RepID=UPI0024478751|nr:phage major capsid protein [Stenotrophomonas maltophilia]MDH0632237.1 phage major capsid protein [Stenotrophomonas maltophilia]MDH0651657.1 phage major capsid protein [Stenotrophomonas maltophilia]MDH0721623.1 phage major capsid protein [Stenotrophomonas maltophilia]MDH0920894.1 phage major capsid protein [Stenotrophomonas maltophilia]MDH1120961.1 phage major capsid protein [Stenotrophomonas maltophilia]
MGSTIRRAEMPLPDDIQHINASLEKVGTNLKAYKESTEERLNAFQADMQALQQTVAAGAHNLGPQFSTGPSVGTRAAEAISTDPSFAAARDQAERNMKVSQFAARANIDASIKAALTNEGKGNTGDTGIPSQAERRGLFGPVLAPLRLLDVLPSRPTKSDAVEFIQFSGSGEAAEQEHEGDTKAELEFEGTAARAEIVTIAGWTTASKQVLSDAPALQAQIDRVIRHKVLSKLEDRLINGVGGQGKINGLWNQATALVPAIGETPADMIGESLVTMANAGYAPSIVLMNPLDWFRLQITRKNDTDDEYVFGSPTAPAAPSLWNTRIVPTPSMAGRRVLTIDTSLVTVLDREQMSVVLSNTHADYFVRNLVAILGELRAGLEILDTAAVRKFELPAVGP